MAEYIERKAAYPLAKKVSDAVAKGEYHTATFGQVILDWIDDIPAADVVEVRHGTWIKADEQPYFRKHYHTKVCSGCGKRKDGKWLYCPYCGSKNQDGGKDNG